MAIEAFAVDVDVGADADAADPVAEDEDMAATRLLVDIGPLLWPLLFVLWWPELLPQRLLLLLAIEEVEEQPDDDEFDCVKLWILLVAYSELPPLPNGLKLVDVAEVDAKFEFKLTAVLPLWPPADL